MKAHQALFRLGGSLRAVALCCLLPGAVVGAPAADTAFFESKVRPVLVKHCYECHSTEAGKSKGGLLLDSREGIRAGGDTGPAVVPGDVQKSLLLSAIKHTDPDLEMPPKKPQLPKTVIADLETWVKSGAVDPREVTAGKHADRPPVDLESGRKFWSYQKPARHPLPNTKGSGAWALRTLDHFVLAKLEANELSPSADAERVAFLRRLCFDLTGLPPTMEEVTAFSMEKLESTVDRLLASKEFGVRWGKYWLDVARFAESNGRESNLAFPHAWRFRDYVIDAVNADVPYDRFITEQIAGDLLPARDEAERARLMIATGFLALGPKGLNEMNKAQFAADLADEQLDTVSRAVMASSVACARCHDHKTEPFSMEDYYAFSGIFKSTQTFFGTWIDSENNNGSHLLKLPHLPGQLVPNKPADKAQVARLKADLSKLNQEEREQNEYLVKARLSGKDISGESYKLLATAIRILWSRGGIEGRLETLDDQGRALPLCMGVTDAPKVEDASLYERGELARAVKLIPRAYPRVIELAGVTAPPKDRSGRLELAKWLTHPDHPLTARVMANRVWRHLFGAGIVRTVDNFGFSGERPAQPELLDHLALKFIDSGWSLKALIREIVLSRTYRQAATYNAANFAKDPDNRWLWRANKRRLDAEVIRDSMLAVSGLLDTTRRPASLIAELDGQSVSLMGFSAKIPADLDGSRHRAIYLPVVRDHLPDALEQFDAANPNMVTGDRDVTNVPMQALYLMNGSFVQTQAAALASRVMKAHPTLPERIRHGFALCFNRDPDAKEEALARRFFENVSGDEATLMTIYCQALLASAEFRYID